MIATATALGILVGVAHVLTGRLGLPIGVHFGGVALFAIMQKPLYFGLSFPSLLVAEPLVELTFAGLIELWVVRVFTSIILVGLWVRLTRGGITVTDRFCQPE